jgi:hypothetical protein
VHPIYRILDSTITGRLRSRLAREWSGSEEVFPSDRTIWNNIMKVWRKNPHFARLHFHAFNAPEVNGCSMNRHLSRQEVNDNLRNIANHPPIHRVIGEGPIEADSASGWACLVMGHKQPNGVAGYYAFVFQDDCLEHGRMAHVSIVPPSASEPCRMEIQKPDGWEVVSPRHINKYPPLRAALLLLQHDLQPLPNHRQLGPKLQSLLPPPAEDEEYMRLVTLAARNELTITHATVAMKDIIPHEVGYLRHSDEWGKLKLMEDHRMVAFLAEWKVCDV